MGMRRRYSLALTVLLSGCAGGAANQSALADLHKQLADSERRTATAEHKIDELENRVFLLTDQVESQKVAAVHRDRPRLPVITLKPTDEPPAEDEDVSFEGEAAPKGPRQPPTVLRIDGTRVVSHHVSSSSPSPEPIVINGEGENLGVAPVPPIHAAAAPSERSAPAVEPLSLYRTAYEDLRAGRHEAAERGFREFVKRFPHHDYADNAQYWLGETFYDRKLYERAAPEFRAVVSRWPTGNKAPDALLKLGFCLLAAGDAPKARAILRELPASYPHTDAARLAEERLAQLHSTEAP